MNQYQAIAVVLSVPEIRFVAETQSNLARCQVEISGHKEEVYSLTVSAWKNQADTLMALKLGDRVCLQGKLKIDRVDRDGAKETVCQLVVSSIHPLAASAPSAIDAVEIEETENGTPF